MVNKIKNKTAGLKVINPRVVIWIKPGPKVFADKTKSMILEK